jgi:hypothetical protein
VPTTRSRCRTHSARAERPERPEVRDPLAALDVLTLAVDQPLRPQVVLMLLDAEHTGGSIVVFDTSHHDLDVSFDDAVVHVASLVTEAGIGPDPDPARWPAVVLATVRPGRSPLIDPLDARRFDEADRVLADGGITLLDWFLIGDEQCSSVAEHIGAPWRWKGDEPQWADPPR